MIMYSLYITLPDKTVSCRDRGDRKLTVEFTPSAVQDIGAGLVPHTLTISTADVEKAGTECDVTVKVFGDKGASEEVTTTTVFVVMQPW